MSTYDIQITEPAERDLIEIGTYLSKQLLEPETAKKVISKIAQAVYPLEEMPVRNGIVSDRTPACKGIRKIISDNYIIFYTVDEERKTVTIIRILSSRRDWLSLL